MSEWRVPFNRASLTGRELRLIAEAVDHGHISGDGPFTRRCESALEELTGTTRALLTTSCTHALELAALLLDVDDGDDVIIPAFTFVSSATAFALRGARIVFADVRADTLNLDEAQVAELVSEQTRAIVPVHYAGVGCEMDALVPLAEEHGAAIVEDNAHGLFASYRGRALGTFGTFAAQSFHETKNITCGEGGALLVNDERYVDRAEIVREKGTNRKRFFRGLVDKYTWVDIGSSYVLSDLLAAFLAAQLDHREEIQQARGRLWQTYDEELREWAAEIGATRPYVPEHCEQPFHMYYLLLPSEQLRDGLIAHLRERGILAVFHYLPLNLSEMGLQFGGSVGQCPVAEDVAARLVRLPFYTSMSRDEQASVIEAVAGFPG